MKSHLQLFRTKHIWKCPHFADGAPPVPHNLPTRLGDLGARCGSHPKRITAPPPLLSSSIDCDSPTPTHPSPHLGECPHQRWQLPQVVVRKTQFLHPEERTNCATSAVCSQPNPSVWMRCREGQVALTDWRNGSEVVVVQVEHPQGLQMPEAVWEGCQTVTRQNLQQVNQLPTPEHHQPTHE